MALTHALSTNNYGVAKLIVATSLANGTHTTLTSAMADAVSGDTIFLRDSVTENVTLTPGVNIACWKGGSLNTPTITGTLTMTGSGTCNISGIRLQTNSAPLLTVSGSAASIVNLDNCYLNCTNNTGISFTSTSASAGINITNCQGNLGTTGIGLFSSSSAGTLNFIQCIFGNSGGSTTTSAIANGTLGASYTFFNFPLETSGTSVISLRYSVINSSQITLTHNGTGSNCGATFCTFSSGASSAVSIGAGATLSLVKPQINCTNNPAVTGSGSVFYAGIDFTSSSKIINTTTQVNLMSGTWTPTVDGTVSGTTTYTLQSGLYTIFGGVVTIWARISITAATGTGIAIFGGFPFPVRTASNYVVLGPAVCSSVAWTWPAGTTQLGAITSSGLSTCNFNALGSGTAGFLQMTNGAATFTYSLSYQI